MSLSALLALLAVPFAVLPITLTIDVLTLACHHIRVKSRKISLKPKGTGYLKGELRPSGRVSISEAGEVTVVISAHRESGIIEKSIRSVLRQDYPIKNIYVSDSNLDNTWEEVEKLENILARFRKEFPAIYYWSRKGITSKSEKLNALVRDPGVKLGEYVYFVDSGLKLHSGTIRKLVESIELEGAAAVTSFGYVKPPKNRAAKYFHFGKEWINRISKFRKSAQSYRRGVFVVCGASFMVRSEIARKIPIPTNVQTEDTAYTWKMQEEGYKISFAPDAIVSTGDVPTLQRQLRQSYRWYKGTWQVIYTRRGIFGPRSKAKSLAYLSVLPGLIEATVYTVGVLLFPFLLYFYPLYAAYFLIGDTTLTFVAPVLGPALSGDSRKIPWELLHTARHYHHIMAFKFLSSALWILSFSGVLLEVLTGRSKNWGNKW
ncbi:MAG: glycosyltransferase family 2 protein [Candidatus Aenigmarchaeota archaeon]|nr:glycosyltransferase family 2 protein [Candidatus Aenigmarchaeota archaeon]